MDLRTRLVFAFVSVSLVSMFLLTWLTYGPARDAWRDSALTGLEALAESKTSDIERVIEGWRDRVRLISSRTQLRRITSAHSETHDAPGEGALLGILRDARDAVRGAEVHEIAVYDVHQHLVASSREPEPATWDALPVDWLPAQRATHLVSFDPDGPGGPSVVLTSPVEFEGVVVGTVLVSMSAAQLVEVTRDYRALGATGETVLATHDLEKGIVFVGRPRHETDAAPGNISARGMERPLLLALDGAEGTYFRDAIDYRGREIWAVTRYIDALDAGLMVKVDRTEQEAPLTALRRTSIRLALALSSFAILVAVIMGLNFASPIHQLAEVAEEIYAGNYRVRAPVRREDEIGRLAFLFNRMTDGLLASNRALRQKIAEQEHVPGADSHEGTVSSDGVSASRGDEPAGSGADRSADSGDDESAEHLNG